MATIKNLLIRLGVIADTDSGTSKVQRSLENVADRADKLDRKFASLSGRFDSVGSVAQRVTGHIASFTGSLASAGVSLVTGAAQLATLAAALASAASGAVGLVAALAPAAGALAALPGAAAAFIAVNTVLKLSLYSVGDAMKAAYEGDAKKFEAALEKLTPTARAFAEEFQATVPAMKTFQQAAQTGFFGELNGSLAHFVDLLRGTQPQIQALAATLGGLAREGLIFATAEKSVAQFNSILSDTSGMLTGLGRGLQPLLTGLLDLATVGTGFLRGLSDGVGNVIAKFGAWLTQISASGQALEWMNGALAVFKQLGAILADLGGILKGLFTVMQTSGTGALGVIGQLLDGVNSFVNSAKGQQTLVAVFTALHTVAAAFLPVIRAIAVGIGGLAPLVAQLATVVGPILASIVAAIVPAIAALAPGLIAVVASIGAVVSSLAPVLAPLGAAIGAAFTTLQPLIAAIGPAIAALLPGVQAFLGAFATGVAALAPALMPLAQAISGVMVALAPLLPVIGRLAALIATTLAAGVTAILPSIKTLVAAFTSTVTALSPVLPLLVGLAATLINALVPALAPLLPQLAALITQLVAGLVPAITPLIPIIAQIAGMIAQNFVTVLGVLVQAILPLLPVLSQLAQTIGAELLKYMQQVSPLLPTLVGAFLQLIPALAPLLPVLGELVGALLPVMATLIKGLVPVIAEIVGAFATLIPVLAPIVSVFGELIAALLPPLVELILALAPLIVVIAKGFAQLLTALLPILPPLIQLLTTVLPPIITLIAKLAEFLVGILAPAIQWVVDIVAKAVKWIVDGFTWLYNTLVGNSVIPDLINGMTAWFRKGVSWISDAIGWFARLPGMLADWVGKAKDFAIGKFGDLVNWVRGLPGAIVGALGNIGNLLGSVGHNLIIGLWNGMVGMFDWLKNAIYNFFSSIMPDWVKQALGIASPSKVFAKLGQMLPAGLALGMDQAQGMVAAAADRMAQVAASFAPPTLAFAGDSGTGLAGPAATAPGYGYAGQPAAAAGRGGNVYTITVNVPPSANKADIGAEVVSVIQEYERRSGEGWRR